MANGWAGFEGHRGCWEEERGSHQPDAEEAGCAGGEATATSHMAGLIKMG